MVEFDAALTSSKELWLFIGPHGLTHCAGAGLESAIIERTRTVTLVRALLNVESLMPRALRTGTEE